MATSITDFREYLRGEAPADWTQRWQTAGVTWDVRGMPNDHGHRNALRLRLVGGGTGFNAITWNAPSGNDQEVLALCRLLDVSATTPRVFLRASGAAAAETAYYFGFDSGTTWRLWKVVGGAITSLGSGTGPELVTSYGVAGTYFWVRLQAIGTAVKARVWLDGEAEPGSWLISVTDSAVTTGAPGVGSNGDGDASMEWDFVSVSTDPSTTSAPGKASRPKPLEEWSRNPDVKVDLSVEIEGAVRSTGAAANLWVSKLGRKTTYDDYPSMTDIEPVLQSVTIPGRALLADSLFSGVERGDSAKVVLSNDSPGQGKPGFFDAYYLANTYSGRRIIVRAGESGQQHRAAEPLWAGVIKGEPVVTPTDVTFEVAPRAGWLDDTKMSVRKNAGIPTCLENLTTGAVRGTSASSANWDLTSLTVAMRIAIAADPATLGNPLFRSASASNQWVTVLYNTAFPSDVGKFAVQVTFGGVLTEIHKSGRVDDGAFHDVIWSLRDKVSSYLMVDGEVVSEYTPAASIGTASGAGLSWLTNFIGKICDGRIYRCYLEPDEASAVFSQRADADSRCVGMWRFDDGLGPTANDYSTTGNDVTIAGTENTNFAWVASELGDSGLAGQSMPFVSGDAFGVEAPIIDVARSHARYGDEGAIGGNVTVKVRGFEVAVTTDYTENDGVLDFTDPPAEPVTVDVFNGGTVGTVALEDLTERVEAAVEGETVSVEHFEALDAIAPWPSGYAWTDPPAPTEYLKQMLGNAGAWAGTDRWGRIAPIFMVPPINPGPYGPEPLLEFSGNQESGVVLPSSLVSSGIGGSWAMGFWVKFWQPNHVQNVGLVLSTMGPFGQLFAGCSGRFGVGTDLIYRDQVCFGVQTSGGSLYQNARSPAGFFRHATWYYVLISHDTSASANGTIYLSAAALGSKALTALGSKALTTGYNPQTSPLIIGGGFGATTGLAGSIAYVSIFSAHKTASDVNAYLTARPTTSESDLVALLPMTEGQGDTVTDSVGGGTYPIVGARWCPRLTIDTRYSSQGAGKLSAIRMLRPASRVEVRYRKNFRPLEGTDLAPIVEETEEGQAQRQPFLAAVRTNDVRSTYPDSREIVIESAIAGELDAIRAAGWMADRFAPGRKVIDAQEVRRQILALNLGDEIHFYDPRFEPSGKALRAVQIQTALEQLKGNVGGWG